MPKPIIGIPCGRREMAATFGIKKEYIEAVTKWGGIPVLLPSSLETGSIPDILSEMDGIMLSGGGDIEPSYYGSESLYDELLEEVDPERDFFEIEIAKATTEKDLPLLGICRGIQVLNVACGGTLIQDIPTNSLETINHNGANHSPTEHSVFYKPDSKVASIIGLEYTVNSIHHQAIERIGSGLQVSGQSQDGVIEAIELPGKRWVIGVQWHPERMQNEAPMAKIFCEFVGACEAMPPLLDRLK